ncbi:MAG: ferrous iron transport protein A [Deltaproteobacteria bacterium]|nr:ferrous iron transport protein A [Deltaproteobacteria bacterium]
MSLADLPVGARARVLCVALMDELGDRLVELGMTPGAPVEVLRRGVLGGPVQVRIRDFALSLRRDQAGAVQVALGQLVAGQVVAA